MGKDRQIDESFGSLLKYYPEYKGISIEELSKRCGVSRSYISRLENNLRRCPTYAIIENLGQGLDIDVSMLINNEKNISDDIVSLQEMILTKDFNINGKKAYINMNQRVASPRPLIGAQLEAIPLVINYLLISKFRSFATANLTALKAQPQTFNIFLAIHSLNLSYKFR